MSVEKYVRRSLTISAGRLGSVVGSIPVPIAGLVGNSVKPAPSSDGASAVAYCPPVKLGGFTNNGSAWRNFAEAMGVKVSELP